MLSHMGTHQTFNRLSMLRRAFVREKKKYFQFDNDPSHRRLALTAIQIGSLKIKN